MAEPIAIEMKRPATRKKPEVLKSGNFYSAPVEVGRDFIIIKLPRKVVPYLGMDNNEIYWAPVNGVIQISGKEPHIVIPMMTVDADQFLPQKG